MPAVELHFSLEEATADKLRQLAASVDLPVNHYLAELIENDAKRRLDKLADEGYRALADSSREWSQLTWPTNAEGWPAWFQASRATGGSSRSNR